jgi:hypothetical protein
MNKLTILRIAAATWVGMLLIAAPGLSEAQSICYATGIYTKCTSVGCWDEPIQVGPAAPQAAHTAIQQCAGYMAQMVIMGNSGPGSGASIKVPCAVYCTSAAITGPSPSPGQGTAGSSGAGGLTTDQIFKMQEQINSRQRWP